MKRGGLGRQFSGRLSGRRGWGEAGIPCPGPTPARQRAAWGALQSRQSCELIPGLKSWGSPLTSQDPIIPLCPGDIAFPQECDKAQREAGIWGHLGGCEGITVPALPPKALSAVLLTAAACGCGLSHCGLRAASALPLERVSLWARSRSKSLLVRKNLVRLRRIPSVWRQHRFSQSTWLSPPALTSRTEEE